MFKKLSVRVSVVLILVLGFVITLFTIYLVEDRSEQMRNTIFRKGIAAAQTGAKIMSVTLDHLVDNKIYTREQLFNDSLVLIPIPNHVLRRYGALSADELSKLNQYHYVTGLDTYLDNLILLIEDEFFKDEQVIFAVLSDNKGYTPTHNSISNYPLSGDYKTDLEKSKSKKIYYDSAIAHNSKEAYLFTEYNRDTGEELWRISSPVFVKGQHWGSFRIGYSMQKTADAIADLRNKLILLMGLMLLVSVVVIYRVIHVMMLPLRQLQNGVEKLSNGDLTKLSISHTNDEVGRLAMAFNKMTENLANYLEELKYTTAAKERIQSELKVGNEIQTSMLPHIFPAYPQRSEFDIYATMEPAKEVGGDFYDFFFIDHDTFCFVIGDVSGKGVPSALFMVITKTLLQTEASKGLPLNEVLQNVNRMLCHNNAANMFATVSVGVINFNTGNIILANAGHVPPLHKRANGSFNYVNIPANIVLGVDDEFDFELFNYQLKPTETLFLYTDGVTEAMNKQEQEFSEERLLRVFAKIPHTESQRIVKKIRAEIQDFADGEDQSDDITMLALTYFGPKSLHSEES